MTPDPLQTFRNRNARDARDEKNARRAQIAFLGSALVLVLVIFFAGAL